MERSYEFRRRMMQVHKPNRAVDEVWQKIDGLRVDGNTVIYYPRAAERVMRVAAKDLQDYFDVSMNVQLRAVPSDDMARELENPAGKIIITTEKKYAPAYDDPGAFRITVGDGIIITGNTPRAAERGCFALEDMMNLNEGPVVGRTDVSHKPLFSPRMVHSGYSLDYYPDEHLAALAHAGFDAVLVFTTGVDMTPTGGYLDFGDLVYRAAGYGIDVYAYSEMLSEKHPDDPDAGAYYESTYGRLFEKCNGLRGVVLVGESVEFPSKDERTTGESHRKRKPGDKRPAPGWFPCRDYPQGLNMVKDVIREKKPDADIVFWTYNWGYVAEDLRLELIRNLPRDVSLQATFEMFEHVPLAEGVEKVSVDYTASVVGPGKYFASEAKAAKERGIPLYTMCNTGGLTWDYGVIPYEPAPYQWLARFAAVVRAQVDYGLSGLMESHHYGTYPSFITDLAKAAFTAPARDMTAYLRALAVRDFGKDAADGVLDVWRDWSDAIARYIPTNSDQYGPCRIGPAYPLLFRGGVTLPSEPHTHFGGNSICYPMYAYKLPRWRALLHEIGAFAEVEALFKSGNDRMEKLLPQVPAQKREEATRMYGIGRFMEFSSRTVVNTKRWFLQKTLLAGRAEAEAQLGEAEFQNFLQSAAKLLGIDPGNKEQLAEQMAKTAAAEIKNARRTVPFVEYDSRLGYEPSMRYMCDREHLEWKIAVTEHALDELRRFCGEAKGE